MAGKSALAAEQEELLARIERDVAHQLESKPKRLAHTLSVADTAAELARAYGADEFAARVAGLLHDWHKAYGAKEQIALAEELGLDYGVDLALVAPLLHGALTAATLPARYPELPGEVWSAIARHTAGAKDMSALDMVVFIADAIEPLRPATPAIEGLRAKAGSSPLPELYFETFAESMAYVIETRRYLWPETLVTYNGLVLKRK